MVSNRSLKSKVTMTDAENCMRLFETQAFHAWTIISSLFPQKEVELCHLKMVNYSLIYSGESSLLYTIWE